MEGMVMKTYHKVGARASSWLFVSMVVVPLLLFVCASHGLAQNEPAFPYLKISPYARANGMGQAFVALSDQESPYYNPAGLGLFYLSHHGSFTLPRSFDWLPAFSNEIRLRIWAAHIGYNLRNTRYRLPFSVGIGFYRTKFDYGETCCESGYDRAHHFVFSLGIDSVVDGALGITYKRLRSHVTNFAPGVETSTADFSAHAFDIGSIVKVPVVDLLLPSAFSSSDFVFRFDPSFGICWSNIGPGISYGTTIFDYDDKTPLPKTFKYGTALETGLTYRTCGIEWNLFTLIGTLQWDKNLVGEDGVIMKKRGLELAFADFFSYRTGGWKDKYFNTGENEWIPTQGYGVSLRGVVKPILMLIAQEGGYNTGRVRKLIDFLNTHFDVRYDRATYDADDSPLADFECYSCSIVF